MKQFNGFPARTSYTPIPAAFFSQLLPEIEDILELKITLQIFRLLYPRKGFPRYVTLNELAADPLTKSALPESNRPANEIIRTVLDKAVARGTFISVNFSGNRGPETIYLLNTPADRAALEKIESGQVTLPEIKGHLNGERLVMNPPNIYTLYENNIGLLTPLIAEEIKDAEQQYPASWIEEAITEAVKANKRNWRYINRILERWSTEGKKDGTYQRDTKKTDPEKYYRGEYGHLFRR